MKKALFTIVSKNYLGYARVLVESFLKHNTGVKTHVLLVDRVENYFDPEEESFELTAIDDLGIRDPSSFCFKYNVTELNTAVKPFFFDFLFRKYGYEKILYFDPDILITDKLDGLFDLLDRCSIILTPHITSPIPDDGKTVSEIELLVSGAYNLGFMGLSHYDGLKGFLDWWKDRLYKYCFSAPAKGLFVDQKWIDLVPGMRDDVCILRDSGYNVAYWNLHERRISDEDGRLTVNGQKLYFFHFSGFDVNDLNRLSKYQSRYTLKNVKILKKLFEKYRDHLVDNEHLETKDWPYSFGVFDNGVKIPDMARRHYYGQTEGGKDFGNPFEAGAPNSFFSHLGAEAVKGSGITNLVFYVYRQRVDLQEAFPDLFGKDSKAFLAWCHSSLEGDHGVDKRLVSAESRNDSDPDSSAAGKSKAVPGRIRLVFNGVRIKDWIWKIGRRYSRAAHKVPLLRVLADRIYLWLARDRYFMPSQAVGPEAVEAFPQAGPAESPELGVNVAGYLDTESGVGEAARGIIRALEKADIPHSLRNIEQVCSRRDDRTYRNFSESGVYPIHLLHVNADQLPKVVECFGEKYFHGKYRIGYWFWELSVFPEEWHRSYSYIDELWVGSDFCLEALSAASSVPVVKIPPSIEVRSREGMGRKDFGLATDDFTFLMVFDFLSYVERKNPMAVLEAFRQAFSPDENVTLVVKSINSSFNKPMYRTLLENTKGMRVKTIDHYLGKEELHSLIDACDGYVSLHRSEGFGLPIAEAMWFAKPVIATAYSGSMELTNINNSYPVKYELTEIPEDCGPYKKGMTWADPDISHAAELMRFVYEERDEALSTGRKGAEHIRENYSPDVVAPKVRARLQHIIRRGK